MMWSEVAFVETSRFDGMLVEAFVYGTRGLERWLARTRKSGRPTVDRLVAESIVLVDSAQARALRQESRRAVAAGPEPMPAHSLAEARYAVSALLDDLADAGDSATEFAVAAALWRAAAELSLQFRRRWIGSGKWLVRELCRDGDPHGLAAWAAAQDRSRKDLMTAVEALLDDVGGHLQEGMLRGECPPEVGATWATRHSR